MLVGGLAAAPDKILSFEGCKKACRTSSYLKMAPLAPACQKRSSVLHVMRKH